MGLRASNMISKGVRDSCCCVTWTGRSAKVISSTFHFTCVYGPRASIDMS